MTYYPYISRVGIYIFRLEALHACSVFSASPHEEPQEPSPLEIALAVRIKDLEIGLRAVIDRAEGNFSSPRLRGLTVSDLDDDVVLLATAALETPC